MTKKKYASWQEIVQADINTESQLSALYNKRNQLQQEARSIVETLSEKQYVQEYYRAQSIGKNAAKFALFAMLSSLIVFILLLAFSKSNTVLNDVFAFIFIGVFVLAIPASIVYWVVKRITTLKRLHINYSEEYMPKQSKREAEKRQMQQEATQLDRQIAAVNRQFILPDALRPHLDRLFGYFYHARAHTLEEAVALLNKELGQARDLERLREQLEEARMARAAVSDELFEMKQARAAANNVENAAMWLELEESLKYLNQS